MEINSTLTLNTTQYKQALNESVNHTVAAVGKINQGFSAIKTAFAGILSAAAVKSAFSIAENFSKIQGTIKNATSDLAEFAQVNQSAFQAAQKLGVPFEQMAAAVTALLPPMKTLGASTKTVQTFAETLTAAFQANGYTGGAAVIQSLAKSFNSGSLNAKAFNAALLAVPDLAANIAQKLGKTEAEIKQLGVSGSLAAGDFIKAINALNGEYTQQAKNTQTMANAFNYLKNSIAQFLSKANEAGSISAILAQALRLVADNIDKIVIAGTVLLSLKVAQFFSGTITSLTASAAAWGAETAAIMANTRARAANAITTGAGTAGAGLNLAGSAVVNLAGLAAGIKATFSGILKTIGKGGIIAAIGAILAVTGQWQNSIDAIKYVFTDVAGVLKNVATVAKNAIVEIFSGFDGGRIAEFFSGFDNGIFGLLEMIGKTADGTVSLLKTTFAIIINDAMAAVKMVGNILTAPIRGLVNIIDGVFNGFINKYNKLASKLKLQKLDNLDFSEIKQKITFDANFTSWGDAKTLFDAYQKEQQSAGLEAYFRQMKTDIDASRAIAEQANTARQAEADGIAGFAENLDNLNGAIAEKTAKLAGGKSATDLQIEIEKLYKSTDFSSRNAEFYSKIDELQNAIGAQAIDWAAVAAAVDGINQSGRLDLSVPTAAMEAQTIAVQANTAAIQQAQAVASGAAASPAVVVQVVGNVDNLAEFISVKIDEKIARFAAGV